MKKCIKCKKEKNEEDFYERKVAKNGFYNTCKECMKKEAIKNYWRNPENKKQKRREYVEKNKEKVKKADKLYCQKNKETIRIRRKKYRNDNKQELAKKSSLEYKRKMREDITFVLSQRMSGMVRKSLKGRKNDSKWETLVNYNKEDLLKHLLKTIPEGFTEEDFKKGRLHIDHIIPQSKYYFNSYDDKEFKKCWALKNLRLLSAIDNLSKWNKIDKKLIEEFNLFDILPESVE